MENFYYGPEIITPEQDIKITGNHPGKGYSRNVVAWRQPITVICHNCKTKFQKNYGSHRLFMKKRIEKDPQYIWRCHTCKVRDNNKKIFKGKTLVERVGAEQAAKIRKKLGVKGPKNPQFGKPAYNGGGNGWSGWYRGEYFRSLKELSFRVNYIERFSLEYRTMEHATDAIPYIDYKGSLRNYFPDYLINGRYVVEIKPKQLWNSKDVLNKKQAAVEYCGKNNYIYKIIDPIQLKFTQISMLYEAGLIVWLERYRIKFIEYLKTQL